MTYPPLPVRASKYVVRPARSRYPGGNTLSGINRSVGWGNLFSVQEPTPRETNIGRIRTYHARVLHDRIYTNNATDVLCTSANFLDTEAPGQRHRSESSVVPSGDTLYCRTSACRSRCPLHRRNRKSIFHTLAYRAPPTPTPHSSALAHGSAGALFFVAYDRSIRVRLRGVSEPVAEVCGRLNGAS